MIIEKTYSIFFSPTGNTQKCVQVISRELDTSAIEIDLTDPHARTQSYKFGKNDLVIIGVPVYAGRIPQLCDGLLDKLKGNQTPAVFIVSYGNRDYDDALLELKTVCEANGFKGIAAGAFIGVHSFDQSIAANRPDEQDISFLNDFARKIKAKIASGISKEEDLYVKGNYPYREWNPIPFTPLANENCGGCNQCVSVCPVEAISAEDVKVADSEKCIDCYACVRICPNNARSIVVPAFIEKIETMKIKLSGVRKEPEMFI